MAAALWIVAGAVLLSTAPCAAQVPDLPGFCLFARGAAILSSRAGAVARADLDRIEGTIAKTNAQERQQLVDAGLVMNRQRTDLAPDDFRLRADALAARAQRLDETIQAFSRKLAAARAVTQSKIDEALDPVLEGVRARHRCVVVMERNNAYVYANSVDLTPEVVAALDQALPRIAVGMSP